MPRWLQKLFSGREGGEEKSRIHQGTDTDGRLAESMKAAYRLHESGDLEGAERAYRAILAGYPDDADALYLLGEIANSTGRREEAIDLIRRAIASNDRIAAFHHELGLACFHCGRHAEAAAAFRAALALAPEDAPAHVNLGAALQADGKLEEAAQAWRRAVELDERSVGAYCNLASVHLSLGRAGDAWTAIRRAVSLAPEEFEVRMREGDVLLELGRPQDAALSYAHALRIERRSPRGEVALGYALDVAGRLDEAMEHYDRAVVLDPGFSAAHVSRASVLLLKESYGEGWDEYEWRLKAPENVPVHERFRLPVWDGVEPLAGRTVLYYAEQGLGDEIMYASCVPELIEKSGRCIIDCDERLAPLFQRSFPRALVHGGTQSAAGDWLDGLGPVHFKISAASLPGRLRRSSSDFPQHSGYLRANASRVQSHRARLGACGTGPKVGLCWRGGVLRTGRTWRSLDPKSLLPLLGAPGVTYVSLQRDASAAELGFLRHEHGIAIEHWQDALDDVEEAAALVAALDLTISVCTWIVHLAGAQGLPVWVMSPVRPEPRYGMSGSSMRWYPSARLFRQRAFGAWDDVVDAVSAQLRAFLADRR